MVTIDVNKVKSPEIGTRCYGYYGKTEVNGTCLLEANFIIFCVKFKFPLLVEFCVYTLKFPIGFLKLTQLTKVIRSRILQFYRYYEQIAMATILLGVTPGVTFGCQLCPQFQIC